MDGGDGPVSVDTTEEFRLESHVVEAGRCQFDRQVIRGKTEKRTDLSTTCSQLDSSSIPSPARRAASAGGALADIFFFLLLDR